MIQGFNSSQYKLMRPRKAYTGATKNYTTAKVKELREHYLKLGCTIQAATIKARNEIEESKKLNKNKLSVVTYDNNKKLQGEIIKVIGGKFGGIHLKVNHYKTVIINSTRIHSVSFV